MHMSDALLSLPAAAVMCAASGSALALSARGLKKRMGNGDNKWLPATALCGAFIFSAQMINFTIPGTGSSGHICGGILAACLLGEAPALIAIASVLVIQALFFADGGLMALGANIFNMGVIPCLCVYPLILKPLVKNKTVPRNVAVIISCIAALELGAAAVVTETTFSHIAELPFKPFFALMLPIHFAIGAAEGVVSAAIISFISHARPEMLYGINDNNGTWGRTAVCACAAAALIIGCVLSGYASSLPDGLEWSIAKVAGVQH